MAETLWIDAPADLAELCVGLARHEWLAVDTEFLSDRSYVPRLCLVQVASADVVACVDPLAPGLDLAPLWTVLADPAITKVFHAAENDLGVLVGAMGAVPGPVFDTQVAAAFCGHGGSIGYGALVERLCGVVLDKSHARTDWSRRPLPRDAVRYAAGDVRYLRDVFHRLREELDRRCRAAWAAQEFADLADPLRYRADPADAWRRVRGARLLSGVARGVLRELAQWREVTARATNRPRRSVLSDEVLVEIARAQPADAIALERTRGFDAKRGAGDVPAILAMVRHGAASLREGADAAPEVAADLREAALVDALSGLVRLAAAQTDVPLELVASGSDLLRLARGQRDVPVLDGWRREIAGESLVAFLGGRSALVVDGDGLGLRPTTGEMPR